MGFFVIAIADLYYNKSPMGWITQYSIHILITKWHDVFFEIFYVDFESLSILVIYMLTQISLEEVKISKILGEHFIMSVKDNFRMMMML